MNENETLAALAALLYLEREAVRGLELAEPLVDSDMVSRTLLEFRDDHQEHVTALNALVGRRDAREPSHEWMALVQEQLRLIRGASDEDEVLRALLLMERTVAARYAEMEETELSSKVAEVVRRHHSDEQRHVDYVEQRSPVAAGVVSEGVYSSGTAGGLVEGSGPGTGGSLGGAVSGASPARDTIEREKGPGRE